MLYFFFLFSLFSFVAFSTNIDRNSTQRVNCIKSEIKTTFTKENIIDFAAYKKKNNKIHPEQEQKVNAMVEKCMKKYPLS